MLIEILPLDSLPQQESFVTQTEKIFFESSSKTHFTSDDERAQFRYRYFGIYLQSPQHFFVALRNNEILGYLAGSADTNALHFQLHPYLEAFRSTIEHFPSHLHINLSEKARGLGIGSKLIQTFENHLQFIDSKGVHLITSHGARNVSFYQKNDYRLAQESFINSNHLLMFAKSISSIEK